MQIMTFSELLEQKYLHWQNEQGRRKTLDDFANYLGVGRPVLSSWLTGNRKPNNESLVKLSYTLGLEVYDVLGLPRPNPYLQIINRLWEYIPEDIQKRLSEEVEKYEAHDTAARVQKTPKPRKTKHAD